MQRYQLHVLAFALGTILWLGYILWRAPLLLLHDVYWLAGPVSAMLLALWIGYAISVIVLLFWRNRHRLRSVLRPNKGRMITSILLALLTPFGMVGKAPLTWGAVALMLSFAPLKMLVFIFPKLLPLILCNYPISAVVISGVKQKPLRTAIFCLILWAEVAALVLWRGIHTFSL